MQDVGIAQALWCGPGEAEILQFPRTASSGRKLMLTILGASYDNFIVGSFSECFILHISLRNKVFRPDST